MTWLEETLTLIEETKRGELEFWVQALPLARTPMDKKMGSAMKNYAKQLFRMIMMRFPLAEQKRKEEIKRRLKEPPRSTKPQFFD